MGYGTYSHDIFKVQSVARLVGAALRDCCVRTQAQR